MSDAQLPPNTSSFPPNANGCPYMHSDPPGVCNKCGWITDFPSKGTVARAYEMFEARLASLAEEKPDSEPTVEDWHECLRAALSVIDRPLHLVTPFSPEELDIIVAGLRTLLAGRADTHLADCDRCQLAQRTVAKVEGMRG